jgi:hypothetical protein
VEYRYGGQRLSKSQSFVCCVSRKSSAMIKGSSKFAMNGAPQVAMRSALQS